MRTEEKKCKNRSDYMGTRQPHDFSNLRWCQWCGKKVFRKVPRNDGRGR